MDTRHLIIKGDEPTEGFSPELKALNLFYTAFNQKDMQLMGQSWLRTNDISMDNPIGGIRRGWEDIAAGYQKIFEGKADVYVEFYDFSLHSSKEMFFVTGRERGYFKTEGQTIDLAIRTSRVFIRADGGWKQIHHHGSIDQPELLQRYQEAVFTEGD